MSTFLRMYFKYQTSVTSYVCEHIFPSCRPQFVLLIVDFVLQNFLNIMKSNLLIMILSPCALVFSSGCCLLCQRVLSLSLHSLLLAQDIWFHIEVLIISVLSIVNGYRNGSICILWNADLIRQEQLAEESLFH